MWFVYFGDDVEVRESQVWERQDFSVLVPGCWCGQANEGVCEEFGGGDVVRVVNH